MTCRRSMALMLLCFCPTVSTQTARTACGGESGETELPRLPPLWRARMTQSSGWRAEGTCGGSVAVALRDAERCFELQGWDEASRHIISKRAGQKRTLVVWEKKRQRLLLLVCETGPGSCRFSFGVENTGESRQGVAVVDGGSEL